jgi:hypothetical protein
VDSQPPAIIADATSPAEPVQSASAASLPAGELGVSTFLLSGAFTSGVVGLSGYWTRAVSEHVLLRPSIAVGEAPASAVRVTWAAARLDLCLRTPSEDPVRAAVQADLCVGSDGGFSYVASGNGPGAPATGKTLPYFDLGPSLDLRSTIGNDVAVTLRGGLGVNFARSTYVDVTGNEQQAPAVSARVELAIAWLLK